MYAKRLLIRNYACPRILVLTGLLLCVSTEAHAQLKDNLYIYGYFQGKYSYYFHETGSEGSSSSSFALQQINFLFKKNVAQTFSSFIDVEAVNTFSSSKGWGSLQFSEAWVSYRPKRLFRIKLGLQVPVFNNLNDIKNRTPLLPYIFRPIVYESSFSSFISVSTYAPDQAFLSIDGTIVAKRLKVDYNFYTGNESEFVPPDGRQFSTKPPGTDTTKTKLWGGRIGVRKGSFKAGISATTDHTNQQQLGLGSVRKNRIGGDLSFSFKSFFIESEFITILHKLNATQEQTLALASSQNPVLNDDLNKLFYYVLLGYRYGDHITFYVSHDHMEDKSTMFTINGVESYSAGMAYRPKDPVVFKAQYINYFSNPGDFLSFDFSGKSIFLAVSLFF